MGMPQSWLYLYRSTRLPSPFFSLFFSTSSSAVPSPSSHYSASSTGSSSPATPESSPVPKPSTSSLSPPSSSSHPSLVSSSPSPTYSQLDPLSKPDTLSLVFSKPSHSSTVTSSPSPPVPDSSRRTRKALPPALKNLFKETDPDRLVTRIATLSSSRVFRHSSRPYEYAVRLLTGLGRPDALEAILEPLKLHPSEITREGFAAFIITLYGRAGLADHAARTFDELPALGCRRTVVSFTTLLSALINAGDPARAVEAFRGVSAKYPEIQLNLYSYNVFLRALFALGEIGAAETEMEKMEGRGMTANIVTFDVMMSGYHRHGLYDAAERVWAALSERGLPPDRRIYNTRMLSLASQGRISEARQVYSDMQMQGIKPNAYTYNALITVYCKEDDLPGAREVFAKMKEKDCRPNAATFEALIPAACDAGELDFAYELGKWSVPHGVSAGVLQRVMDELVKADRVEDSKKLLEIGWTRIQYKDKLKMHATNIACDGLSTASDSGVAVAIDG